MGGGGGEPTRGSIIFAGGGLRGVNHCYFLADQASPACQLRRLLSSRFCNGERACCECNFTCPFLHFGQALEARANLTRCSPSSTARTTAVLQLLPEATPRRPELTCASRE